jgi:hypothetical protein
MSTLHDSINKGTFKRYDLKLSSGKILLPLEMRFEPKEDITAFELAMCITYINRSHGVMPFEIDISQNHFRHFKIIDHNK